MNSLFFHIVRKAYYTIRNARGKTFTISTCLEYFHFFDFRGLLPVPGFPSGLDQAAGLGLYGYELCAGGQLYRRLRHQSQQQQSLEFPI